MKIAIEGCSHGELDKIYTAIQHVEKQNNFKVDLLLCCGDFQAVRNNEDLESMAVPPKYRRIQDFHQYYSGKKTAPILTVFIGGNHEASNYLAELPYGGWVCHNIFFMGYANVIEIGGIRIAGLSGIYKGQDYLKGHFEIPPYNEGTKRSAYHVRNIDVFRLKQISEPIDIFMSHDWPRGIYKHGDVNQLLKKKPFFAEEVENNTLGSRPAEELLSKLQPSYWFSAHLHVKFAAFVKHETTSKSTRFLALDKCLPRRQFLQILDIPSSEAESVERSLKYDPEWLTILRSTNHLLSTKNAIQYMPGPGSNERWNFTPQDEELQSTKELFEGEFIIPLNFERTAEPYDPETEGQSSNRPRLCKSFPNPQTIAFCKKMEIDDPIALLLNDGKQETKMTCSSFLNRSESDVTLEEVDTNTTFMSKSSQNPDEISLSEDNEEDLEEEEEEEMEEEDVDVDKKMSDVPAEVDDNDDEDEDDDDKSSSSLSPDDERCVVTSSSVPETSSVTDEYEAPTSSEAEAAAENLSLVAMTPGGFVIDRKGNLPVERAPSSSPTSSSPNSSLCAEGSKYESGQGALGSDELSNGDPATGYRKRKSPENPRQMKRRNYAIYAPTNENENDSS